MTDQEDSAWPMLLGERYRGSFFNTQVTKKTGAKVPLPAITDPEAAFQLVSGAPVTPTRAHAGAGLLHTLEDVLEAGLFPGDPDDSTADIMSTSSPTAQQVAQLMTGRGALLGDHGKALQGKGTPSPAGGRKAALHRQISFPDLLLGTYLVVAAGWSVTWLDGRHAFFLAFQGAAFLAAGLDLVGDPS
jgi:hypothetical protein